jgi:hypothetical protein
MQVFYCLLVGNVERFSALAAVVAVAVATVETGEGVAVTAEAV